MDRRQQKSRRAIMDAFTRLLEQKSYYAITVSEIIDGADVGRSTFYAHFDSRDALMEALCSELFDHVIASAMDSAHSHGLYSDGIAPESVSLHILQHLTEHHHPLLALAAGENSEIFSRYFKTGMKEVVRKTMLAHIHQTAVPEDFLINHIAAGFTEMLIWWIRNGMRESPVQLDAYFRTMTEPLVKTCGE